MNIPTPPRLGNIIPVDLAWAAKVSEEAREPALPIVDPHHHLWQRADNEACAPRLEGYRRPRLDHRQQAAVVTSSALEA